MQFSRVTRAAARGAAIASVAIATLANGAAAQAALVITFQQYWSVSSDFEMSKPFTANDPNLYVGSRCGRGEAVWGAVQLQTADDYKLVYDSKPFLCDGQVHRDDTPVPHKANTRYVLVWYSDGGKAPNQGVYAWR